MCWDSTVKPKKQQKYCAPAGSWFFIHVQQNLSKVMVILEEIAIFLDLLPFFFGVWNFAKYNFRFQIFLSRGARANKKTM